MSKEDILEGYLNTIYFGRGAYGVAAASRAYFNIDISQVTESEAALLAGLIRAPASAEPTKHPEEATRRRHTALVAMKDEGYITDEQFAALDPIPVAEPWILPYSSVKEVDVRRGGGAVPDQDYMGTDYLSAYVRDEVKNIDPVLFTDEMIDHGGLRIYTSINYDRQRAAWDAVTSTLPNEDDPATPKYEGDPEAALVSVDDQGLIRAMVGSRHRFHAAALSLTDGLPAYENNYALLGREPGSTFKPLVLAEAVREQISLKSRFDAQGLMEFPQWKTDGEPWEVGNYDESAKGVLDLMQATGQSSNTAYAQLMLELGTDLVDTNGDGAPGAAEGANNVAELAESMGVGASEGGIAEEQRVPSMVLGTVNATPVEMAGVYSTFANRGWYKRPSIITRVEQVDQDGKSTLLWAYQPQPTQVLTETQADLVTHTLTFPVRPDGTAENANLGKDTAGKTGTSQENRNAWFAGFVPRLTTVVWMGYPDAGETGWDDPETPEFRRTAVAHEPQGPAGAGQDRHRRLVPRHHLEEVHGGRHRGHGRQLRRAHGPADRPRHGDPQERSADVGRDHHHCPRDAGLARTGPEHHRRQRQRRGRGRAAADVHPPDDHEPRPDNDHRAHHDPHRSALPGRRVNARAPVLRSARPRAGAGTGCGTGSTSARPRRAPRRARRCPTPRG